MDKTAKSLTWEEITRSIDDYIQVWELFKTNKHNVLIFQDKRRTEKRSSLGLHYQWIMTAPVKACGRWGRQDLIQHVKI